MDGPGNQLISLCYNLAMFILGSILFEAALFLWYKSATKGNKTNIYRLVAEFAVLVGVMILTYKVLGSLYFVSRKA